MTMFDANGNHTIFLRILHKQANGDPSFQVSMYEIGEAIGLDRDATQKTAESLMGEGLVEIKTLSGGIGITQSGIEEIEEINGGQAVDNHALLSLSNGLILNPSDNQLVETVIHNIKHDINDLGLGFDDLADITVDIRTVEVQLTAKNPKTAIIRACFDSISTGLEKSQKSDLLKQVRDLLKQ